ncbi:MAG TPA: hypothetical protein VK709_08250 [Candidatus Saccharimonadales bacterium]|jgi:hypothetical protein|nr:hypothetical protein [Candidatus Saccharimonadales bacterium]
MENEKDMQTQIQRLGEIVEYLERTADPITRSMGKELLECVMALHGAALERILEFASDAGEAGEGIIRKCGRDEAVRSVLLLYGLHPESMRTRVTAALEKSHKLLEQHAAHAELVSVTDDGAITLRLEVKSGGCGAASVKSELQAAIQDAAPDASSIVVEEYGVSLARSGFVLISQLESKMPLAGSAAETQVRSVD